MHDRDPTCIAARLEHDSRGLSIVMGSEKETGPLTQAP